MTTKKEILKFDSKIETWETDRGYLFFEFKNKPDMYDVFDSAFGDLLHQKDGFDVKVTVTKGKIIITKGDVVEDGNDNDNI